MNKSTFCILPFIHLEARANGTVAPCCYSQGVYENSEGNPFDLSKDSLGDVWTSQSITNLRKNLIDGVKDEKCLYCWNEESLGRSSKRVRENDRWIALIEPLVQRDFTPGFPEFLDLKLGNTCNLKCRICSPDSSSFWIKEWQDINGAKTDQRNVTSWTDQNPAFWNDIEKMLPDVKLFEIYGGEPLLIKQHYNLLKKSVELGHSKQQRIHYNSNGSVFPEQAIAEIWPHFENVHIMLSIDGIGDQFEYQRHPAKWKHVEKNIFRFKDAFSKNDLQICMTVSSLNAFYIPEYLKYFHSIGVSVWLNLLHGPDHYSIKNLPAKAKAAILEKWKNLSSEKDILVEPIDPLKNLLKFESNPKEEELFRNSLKQHDEYRNESYEKTFPEFAKLILKA